MTVAAIIQARMGATRLPDKIFKPLAGIPLLEHVVRRAEAIAGVDQVIVATTVDPSDRVVETWCQDHGLTCIRGPVTDVLGRYHLAAEACGADTIIRVTADDPFKDPQIAGRMLARFVSEQPDFMFNNKPPTFPEGLDVEIFTRQALATAFLEAGDPFEREHVTQYFYRHPEKFTHSSVVLNRNLSALRWTIDTDADLAMAAEVYETLYGDDPMFGFLDVLRLFREKPQLMLVNDAVDRSAMYNREAPTVDLDALEDLIF